MVANQTQCPPEIWSIICRLACLDGGFTGRSLSLVSRYIHHVSKPFKFQSVAVVGFKQMDGFASILETTPPELKNVQYLFMAHYHTREPVAPPAPRHWKRRIREMISNLPGTSNNYFEAKRKSAERARFRRDMRRILLQVSNSVEILTIVMPDPWQIPLPSDLHLGALVELHLYGTREGREASLETDPPPPPSLPSLKRLHLAGSHFDPTEVIFFITLSPSLTHLRLSGLEYRRGTQYILSAICRLSASYPLPTELERILVQPRQPDFPPVGYTAMMYIRDFEDLMYFAPGLPGVVFMKPLSCSLDVDGSIDDANRFWLSRIGGGLGCWDETPVV